MKKYKSKNKMKKLDRNKMDSYISEANIKKIEIYCDRIIEDNGVGDALDWIVGLLQSKKPLDDTLSIYDTEMNTLSMFLAWSVKVERYELSSKIRDTIYIIYEDMKRVVKLRDIPKDEKEEILKEIEYIKDVYFLTVTNIFNE